jgi:phosphoglycerate dehydrogenase-like enzyme
VTQDVLVTWPDYDPAGAHTGAVLAAAGLGVRLEPKRGARSVADMLGLVASAAGAIVSTDPFDAEVLAAAPELRVIARVGVGIDSIDLDAATARGVAVTKTPGANEATVADHTLALMLAALRRIPEHHAGVRDGEWNRTGAHTPWLLTGATVGLVGYGRIGQLVSDRLHGFGVRVLVADPAGTLDPRVEDVDLDTLLATADVVSLHTPLLPETHNLIGPAELARMRSTAVLVNAARGGVVDEDALAAALREGRLRAAALDVFATEPPTESALIGLPNVVLSPHIAGLSTASIEEMTARATTSVVDVLAGRVPTDLANPAALGVVR